MKVQELFFAQGSEAVEYVDLLDEKGAEWLIKHILANIDETGDIEDYCCLGKRYRYKNYELAVNTYFSWIALEKILEEKS